MSSISSLTKAVSGLQTAQKGLQVTGHNITNTNTKGYTRQQLLQNDSSYLTIGSNGGNAMKVGLGVECTEIRQIRDDLADRRLRTEKSVLCYYQQLNATTSDIESIFDEPYGNTISDLISDFWSQAQKLSTNANGVEERMSFISTAKVLASKIDVVTESLTTYQTKLNTDLKTSVNRINEIIDGIAEYNEKISIAEAGGENANDYRDQRNLLLDELAGYGEISYYEESDKRVSVKFEGHTVVNKQIVTKLKLEQAEEGSPFDVPIWSDTGSRVFKLDDKVTSSANNDTGSLKALLIARGNNIVSKDTTWDDVALNDRLSVDVEGNAYLIPKIQMMLNQFTNSLAEMVNENFNGTGIGGHLGQQGVPVFIATNVPDSLREVKNKIVQGDYTGITDAQMEEYNKYLIGGNIEVNPLLLEDGGYNKLGTVSKPADNADAATKAEYASRVGDNSLVEKFLSDFGVTKVWNDRTPDSGTAASASAPYEKTSNMSDFFAELVTDIGTQGSLYTDKAHEKNISTTNIENERQAIGGVSTDEEFSYMLKYQYAYNASARMITMLDSMLDTIINKM